MNYCKFNDLTCNRFLSSIFHPIYFETVRALKVWSSINNRHELHRLNFFLLYFSLRNIRLIKWSWNKRRHEKVRKWIESASFDNVMKRREKCFTTVLILWIKTLSCAYLASCFFWKYTWCCFCRFEVVTCLKTDVSSIETLPPLQCYLHVLNVAWVLFCVYKCWTCSFKKYSHESLY